MEKKQNRTAEIIRVSFRGIGVNLLLVLMKTLVGLAANSISVLLDAVNNTSDALSSVITIIGTKLAGKAPDRQHPYGHGRVEYVTASVIAIMILFAGFTALKESVSKTLHPDLPSYSYVSLLVISFSIAAKVFLGKYYQRRGKALHSATLSASGTDALFDAVISVATLIAAVLNMLFGWKLEGILGILISVFILKAGIDILRETVSHIIGVRADEEFTLRLKRALCRYPGIRGAYDLILHSYGPEKYFGSVHVEVSDKMTMREFDALNRKIVPEIFEKFGVILTIGIYAANTSHEQARRIKKAVRAEIAKYPALVQMHGFYFDEKHKRVSFDVVYDFRMKQPAELVEILRADLSGLFPDYQFHINLDSDFTE
ncbi:MAG: cation transporter [Oscillospiraceae bacterium]|nr:cation transporter [Oscillospiraceae bacterium]